MLRYKINVLNALREKGVTSYTCRMSHQLSQSTFTYLSRGQMIRPESLDSICSILRCQPGDLIEWVPDEE